MAKRDKSGVRASFEAACLFGVIGALVYVLTRLSTAEHRITDLEREVDEVRHVSGANAVRRDEEGRAPPRPYVALSTPERPADEQDDDEAEGSTDDDAPASSPPPRPRADALAVVPEGGSEESEDEEEPRM